MSAGWSALVLAGSRGRADPVAAAAGVSHKAFAPVAGRPMIAWVLDALAEAGLARVFVSIEPDAPPLPARAALASGHAATPSGGPGPREAGAPCPGIVRLDAAGSPAASALAAFDLAGAPLLIVTADHPLLTPGMIRAAVAGAEGAGHDVAAAVAERRDVERAGNTARRTYLRFSDVELSGCNLFACRTPAARSAIAFWRRLERDRKRPWRMAAALGVPAVLRYAAGRLSSDAAAAALSRAAGCRAGLVRLDEPDAAHDVDRPADLAFAASRLAARRAGAGARGA